MSGIKVIISRDNLNKLYAFVEHCPQEISGFGRVKISGNTLKITEVFIIKQEVTPAHTAMTPDALYAAIQDEAAAGKDTSDWMLWWHSHVNFGTSPSGHDLETIEALSSSSPLIAMIINKSHEMYLRVDVYQPLRLVVTDVDFEVVDEPNDMIANEVKSEIAAKVTLTAEEPESTDGQFFSQLSESPVRAPMTVSEFRKTVKVQSTNENKVVMRDEKGRFVKVEMTDAREYIYGKKTRR